MLVCPPHRTVLGRTRICSITFLLIHTTLPNYNQVRRISAHIHLVEILNPPWSNQNFKHFLLFFSIPCCTKETKRCCKIVRASVSTMTCKPSIDPNQGALWYIRKKVYSGNAFCYGQIQHMKNYPVCVSLSFLYVMWFITGNHYGFGMLPFSMLSTQNGNKDVQMTGM